MEACDDDLRKFEVDGAAPLPVADCQGYVEHEGARIWYTTYGSGLPVILLHGGLGHSGNWGHQIPALVRGGYRVILIDSRGHGRSTRDARPFLYELMASDVLAVMDSLQLRKAGLVGWSDGAVIALILAMHAPGRTAGVFFFGCNMDPSGVKQITWPNQILDRCLGRHANDYAQLSATPDQFPAFAEAVGLMMKTEPNYSAAIWPRFMCRSRSYKASMMNSSCVNMPNTSLGAFRTRNLCVSRVSAILHRFSGLSNSTRPCWRSLAK